MQFSLLFMSLMNPEAVKAAEVSRDEEFPKELSEVLDLSYKDALGWLNSIGWSVDFVVAVIFMMMSVLGQLSDKQSRQIQFMMPISSFA
jgi:hypothetical protein